MRVKAFFDTTILIYAFTQDGAKALAAEKLLDEGGTISVQVLNEFASVARRKLEMDWPEIEEALDAVRVLCEPPEAITIAVHEAALRIARRYRYHIYDSLMIAAALEAGCSILYSEDMQDGQRIEGVTIRNPFAL